jgi:Flp pilus assembly protein TadD
MGWKDLFKRGKAQQPADSVPEKTPSGDAVSTSREPSGKDSSAERLEAAKQLYRQGGLAEAEAVCLDVLADESENADAMHMLGVIFLGRGQLAEAEQRIRQAIALNDGNAAYYSNLGNVLGIQNRTEDAYQCFRQALSLDPENMTALSNSATALLSMGRAAEARAMCQKILELAPEDVGARVNLAAAYMEERDLEAAADITREGLAIQPDNVELLVQLASVLELLNELDEALRTVEHAESVQPGLGRVALLSGVVSRRQGNFDFAVQRLRQALSQGLSEDEQVEAFNQLGLALDAAGAAAEAFAAFDHSNQVMKRVVGQKTADGSAYRREVGAVRSYFTREKFAELGKSFATDDDFEPVFFVGFPRSGTTLMEQVFKSHPSLVTTEERSPLTAVRRHIHSSEGGYPKGLDNLTNDDMNRLRKYFRDFCRDTLGELEGRQLVDKLPMNIVHVALARLLFPRSKILVALRDPRDACLSCFMQKFQVGPAMANFLDLETTGLVYRDVMDTWLQHRMLLEGSWMEYRYEDLVEDFDGVVARVLDFIGVGWHEDIAGYREAAKKRVITTPSYRDVTAPVNSRAVERWRRYEQELMPIQAYLEPFVEEFRYSK